MFSLMFTPTSNSVRIPAAKATKPFSPLTCSDMLITDDEVTKLKAELKVRVNPSPPHHPVESH